MAAVCIVLMVLLYTNKIHFESKRFDDIIVAHTQKMQAKMAAANGNVGVVEETTTEEVKNEEITETTVSDAEANNVDVNAEDKDINK